jgi:hypothetical protein
MEISTFCRQDHASSLPRLSPDRAWPGVKKATLSDAYSSSLGLPDQGQRLGRRSEKDYFAIKIEVKHLSV